MNALKLSSFFRLFITFLLLGWHAAGIAADLPEEFRITDITIDGAHHLKKKKIKSVLTVSPPSSWRTWVPRPTAGEEDIADDAERITQLYKSVGYYHAAVSYRIEADETSQKSPRDARIIYSITEGNPVRVESIGIVGKDPDAALPLTDPLEAIPLQAGTTFEEETYRASRKVLQKQLGGNGYPFAQVSESARIFPATNTAVVTYTIDTGQLCYFGDTTVTGETGFLSKKILQRAITYQAGEMYDAFKVEKSQRDLYNLDIFSAAVLQPETPDPETGVVPLTLELRPKKKRNIKLGVGYGLEDGLRLEAAYTYRNPRKQGGKLYLEAQRTDLMKKAFVGYNQPYFWDSRSALLTESGVLEEYLDSYVSRKLYGTVRFTRSIGDIFNTTVAYFLEYSDLLDLYINDLEDQIAYREDNTYLTSSVFWELVRDTSDSQTNPKTGSKITVSAKVAPQLLGSRLTYVKPSLDLVKYLELPTKTVLAARIRIETIADPERNEEIPIFNRLFLGGANTVRGYAYQKLGPIDSSGNPEGGRSTLLGNLELRRPLIGIVSGVVFLDMGMVDVESFQYKGDIRYSIGAGLRLSTPVGPLRLDYGYQLNPQSPPPGADPDTIGAMQRWRIHFDIGHAF